MNVITDAELNRGKKLAFLAGAAAIATVIALVTTAAAAINYRVFAFLEKPASVPRIVLQTPSQTVARIPTQYAGKRVDCTVTIDQVKNIWSITC